MLSCFCQLNSLDVLMVTFLLYSEAIDQNDSKRYLILNFAEKYIKKLEIRCVDGSQLVSELSGGNQQKVCMAKAFTFNPDILFVSEPTRGIDVGAKKLVLDTLKEFNEQLGTTIIVTSSEIEELRSVCDRIAIVNEGEIAGILNPDVDLVEFGKLMVGVSKAVSNE